MSGIKTVAYVLITLFLGVILRELGFKGARLVFLLGTVSLVGAAAVCVGELLSFAKDVGSDSEEYAVAMLKIVGIGYVFGICADVCTDLGEGTLAASVCLIGRLEILTVSLPFIKSIVEKGISLI